MASCILATIATTSQEQSCLSRSDASVKVQSFSGTPSAADRREEVEGHPPTVAPVHKSDRKFYFVAVAENVTD